jgi:hypothetical protein
MDNKGFGKGYLEVEVKKGWKGCEKGNQGRETSG